jgi:hypothetical protein
LNLPNLQPAGITIPAGDGLSFFWKFTMNPLEQIVHDIFFEKHGNPYTVGKVAEIKGMKSAQVLEWATTHLDAKNRASFMAKLGLDNSIEMQSFLRRAFESARNA